MKINFLTVITCLLSAAFLLPSCMDDDYEQLEFSSESSITGFSINNIETKHTIKTDGIETTYTTTVKGEDYPFAIDQNRHLIYNVDSLPVGTDIRKVVINVNSDGMGLMIVSQNAEKQDSIWEATDSLNFTQPIRFKAIAMSGAYGPVYTAKINVHQQVPDSMQWQCLSRNFDPTIQEQKAIVLGNKLYVFAQQSNGLAVTSTSIRDGKVWTPLQTISDLPNAELSSVMKWGNQIYAIADQCLYTSNNATEWVKVGTKTRFHRLIANVHNANNQKMYAINTDRHFIDTEDGVSWTIREQVPAEFPQKNLMHTSLPLNSNATIDRILVLGQNTEATDTTTCVWSQLTKENTWGDYPKSENDVLHCPKLENQAVIHYNNLLYTFGGTGKRLSQKIPAFGYFFQSEDQGISWTQVTNKVVFPEEFERLYHQANGHYSYVVDQNQFLWVIWSQSGEVWRGRINKLGFAPKE